MNGRRLASIAWLPLIALGGLACFDLDLSGPTTVPGSGLPEERGVALTADEVSFDSHLVWSRDGREIFYLQRASGGLPPAIRAVDVSNKTTRTVDARYSGYNGLTLSADGSRLYFMARDDPSGLDLAFGLYRVFPDGERSALLAKPIDFLGVAFRGPPGFSLSPDNVHAAYSGRDSLLVQNLDDGQRLFLATSAEPQAFSPDGRRLLFTDWDPDWVPGDSPDYTDFIMDLDTGEKESVSLGPIRFGRRVARSIQLKAVRWDLVGIRVLYWRASGEFFIYDVSRGAETRLAFDLSQGGPGFAEAWSEDGGKIAFWSSACLRSSGFLFDYQCHESEDHLHVTAADGRGDKIVAVAYVADHAWAGRAAFAPDGKRIAYILGGRIYLREVP